MFLECPVMGGDAQFFLPDRLDDLRGIVSAGTSSKTDFASHLALV